MSEALDSAVVAAVLSHMNDDHTDDNLLIARAFGRPSATAAEMVGYDADGGVWWVETAGGEASELRVPWPSGPVVARADVRREVVALYDAACSRLGVSSRDH